MNKKIRLFVNFDNKDKKDIGKLMLRKVFKKNYSKGTEFYN